MTQETNIRKKLNGKTTAIVGIPLAVIVSAAVTYGAMTNRMATVEQTVQDHEPRVRKCETSIEVIKAQLDGIGKSLERIEKKLDKD